MILREYQKMAIDKILWSKNSNLIGNDLIVLPTGSGKSVVIANLAKELNEPILILQPTKEILEQNLDKLLRYVNRSEIGIYSASMDEKIVKKFTFATIQSIYKKPELFAHFNLVIIDEAHLVNPKNLSGMFTKFIKAIGDPKIVGFTATPYRLDSKYTPMGGGRFSVSTTIKLITRMRGFFWQRILFNMNIQGLIDQNYLCPLNYLDSSIIEQEDIPLNKSRSEFNLQAYEDLLTDRQKEILKVIEYAKNTSNNILVFCSSIRQAETLAEIIDNSEVITSNTKKKARDEIINRFRDGDLKMVFNVGVLTVGFDHPELDCIILLRPTRSITLYYQMVGRGVRIAKGKKSCVVIDLSSTVKNLGRVETIKLEKVEGKWELLTETGSWHNKHLYSYIGEMKAKIRKIEDKIEDEDPEKIKVENVIIK